MHQTFKLPKPKRRKQRTKRITRPIPKKKRNPNRASNHPIPAKPPPHPKLLPRIPKIQKTTQRTRKIFPQQHRINQLQKCSKSAQKLPKNQLRKKRIHRKNG